MHAEPEAHQSGSLNDMSDVAPFVMLVSAAVGHKLVRSVALFQSMGTYMRAELKELPFSARYQL